MASAADGAEEALPEPESVPATVAEEVEAIGPALEILPPAQREAIVQVVRSQLSHSGPLPSPGQLVEYDHALPGLAERIVRLTEGEQKHRHKVVELAVTREARLKDRGQIFGMCALILLLAFCVLLVFVGSPKIAGGVAIGLIAAVVGIFVTGRRADSHDLERENNTADD